MKKVFAMAALSCLYAAATAPNTMAADATLAVDVNSAYVWRGLTFNDGFVAQPSLDVTAGGFDLNVWGNLDLDDYNGTLDSGQFSEVDLTASYGFALGPVDMGVGFIQYLFPAGGHATSELYLSAGMDLGAGFSGGLELYYDVDQVSSYYATASLGYAYSFTEKAGLELSGLVSYAGDKFAEFYAGGTNSGFFNYTLSAAFNYAFTDALSAGANIAYSDSLDSDTLPDDAVDTTFYGGISIAYSF